MLGAPRKNATRGENLEGLGKYPPLLVEKNTTLTDNFNNEIDHFLGPLILGFWATATFLLLSLGPHVKYNTFGHQA